MSKFIVINLLFLINSLFLSSVVFANADALNKLQYKGKLIPYLSEPPIVELTKQELNMLANEKPIFKQIHLEDSERGIAVFRVNAPAEIVWSVIKDFDSYPFWIKDIKETKTYHKQGNLLYVKFVANGLLGSDLVWHVIHDYPTDDRNWGTWHLDFDQPSDLDDSVGFWRVLQANNQTHYSDVIYSADLKLKGLFTSLFESSLIKDSLKDATQWVKTQAEAKNIDQIKLKN